MNHWPEYIDIW